MLQEILGSERRRRWSDAQKRQILAEVGVNGAKVADVARRHDLTRQHLYQWRNHLRRKSLLEDQDGISFVPVEIAPSGRSLSSQNAGGMVEVLLCNGRSLRCALDFPEHELIRLIRLVERT